jgi:hypothetical protein
VLLTAAIEALQKKVKKGKGVTKAVIAERQDQVGSGGCASGVQASHMGRRKTPDS